jgi:hypothetical protein
MRTISASLLLLLLCIGQAAFAQGKPNVLLIFLDNFGWGEPE